MTQKIMKGGVDYSDHVTGRLLVYTDRMAHLGSKNKANEIARSDKGPPTMLVGDTRMIDEGVAGEWERLVALGVISITVDDLRRVREMGKGKPRGRAGRMAREVSA